MSKKGSLPKLRFPEFRDSREWETLKLEDIAPFQRGFDLPSDKLKTGLIPVVYSNGIQKFHNKGMVKAPGLITGRSGTIGKLHYIESGEYWPHNTSLWVTSFKGNFPKFIYFLYKAIGLLRFASGSGVPTLNRNDIHSHHAYIPSLPEQQRIADCLTSLDEVISSETAKLEAYKSHKKGLMQKLFPAEGEFVPEWRFPEFRNSGEWEEKRFENLFFLIPTNSLSRDKLNYNQGDVKNIHYGDIHKKFNALFDIDKEVVPFINSNELPVKISSEAYCQIGDMILADASEDIDDIGKCIEIINLNNQKLVSGLHTILARPKKKTWVHGFCAYLFQSNSVKKQIQKEAQGTKVLGLSSKRLNTVSLCFPSLPEQQKIADCLTSLDDLISAQASKIEKLKLHKKGLMQGLFPAGDE